MSPVYSIGHSNRTLAGFVDLLHANNIEGIVDIRQFTRSRANPHFNAETFSPALQSNGIAYEHLAELGGRRSSKLPRSPNGLWEHSAFRAYADYALTDEFEAGFARLVQIADLRRTAMMCAEAVWWRCHRRIVTDYLVTRGRPVYHIVSEAEPKPGSLTSGAVAQENGKVIYPPKQPQLF
ncbi:MAG: DUF488 domain-containing protein [Alphaproteobacteria bacterium]|nr:DUF488 domain-containing protein [Alphaproteobacteria bacterium]